MANTITQLNNFQPEFAHITVQPCKHYNLKSSSNKDFLLKQPIITLLSNISNKFVPPTTQSQTWMIWCNCTFWPEQLNSHYKQTGIKNIVIMSWIIITFQERNTRRKETNVIILFPYIALFYETNHRSVMTECCSHNLQRSFFRSQYFSLRMPVIMRLGRFYKLVVILCTWTQLSHVKLRKKINYWNEVGNHIPNPW